jgi:hypothetical protein
MKTLNVRTKQDLNPSLWKDESNMPKVYELLKRSPMDTVNMTGTLKYQCTSAKNPLKYESVRLQTNKENTILQRTCGIYFPPRDVIGKSICTQREI